jgi:hypothetical protein
MSLNWHIRATGQSSGSPPPPPPPDSDGGLPPKPSRRRRRPSAAYRSATAICARLWKCTTNVGAAPPCRLPPAGGRGGAGRCQAVRPG